MNFIDITDFADNQYNLEFDTFNQTTFENIANDVIYDVLNDLLGSDLYNALIADLTGGQPVTQKYIDLVDGKTYIDALRNSKTINYEGIKDMLKCFVFCEYKKYKLSFDTISGTVKPNNENSTQLTDIQLNDYLKKYYTKAVFLYRKVVKFLNDSYLSGSTDYFISTTYTNWNPIDYQITSDIKLITNEPNNYNTEKIIIFK